MARLYDQCVISPAQAGFCFFAPFTDRKPLYTEKIGTFPS